LRPAATFARKAGSAFCAFKRALLSAAFLAWTSGLNSLITCWAMRRFIRSAGLAKVPLSEAEIFSRDSGACCHPGGRSALPLFASDSLRLCSAVGQ
jgi:hypothetical protein